MAGRNLLAPQEPQPAKGRNLLAPLPVIDPAKEMAADIPAALRMAGDTASFGLTDTLRSYIHGTPVEEERKQTQAARDRFGVAGVPVDVAAGMAGPNEMKLVQGGGKLMRTAGHAAIGGTEAMLNEWGHGERNPWELTKAGAEGAGVTGAVSAVTGPVMNWWARRKARAGVPAAKDLKAQGREKYEEVKAAGGTYQQRDMRRLRAQLNNVDLSLDADGDARRLRDWMNNQGMTGDIPPDKLDQIRRIVSQKTRKGSDPVKDIGRQFIEGMDRFTATTPVKSATGATIPGVNETLNDARAVTQKAYKMADVEKAQPRRRGFLNVHGEGSETPSRNRFGKLEEKSSAPGSGYTDAEKAAIAKNAQGSIISNVGEMARKVSPARLFRGAGGAALGLGAAFGGPLGLGASSAATIPEAISALGKHATAKDIGNLKVLVAQGGPAAADPAKVQAVKDELARIMSSGVRAGQNRYGGPR